MIIVLFPFLYFLSKFVFHRNNNISGSRKENIDDSVHSNDRYLLIMNQKDDCDIEGESRIMNRSNLLRRNSNEDFDEESGTNIKFSPPAYIQRYQAVLNVLTNQQYGGKLKKIVDFGCSELGFCKYVKNIVGVEEVLFVDIDRDVLERNQGKAKPLNVDYLHRRSSPLIYHILEGSVTKQDKSLDSCDAVICIELIEHLYPSTLTDVPFNIFGFIRPKVAIITTPNADFNVLFKNMIGFRHPDHKFEWTRKEFQEWAHNITSKYPEYKVTFEGICQGPPGTENLGCCSQMAVFHKIQDLEVQNVPAIEGLYKSVITYDYPYEIDNRSDEQKILHDAVYFILKFSQNDENESKEISLQKILNVMKNFYISLTDLKKILKDANWTIQERENESVVLVPQVTFSDHSDMEDNCWDENDSPRNGDWIASSPDIQNDNYNLNKSNHVNILEEENWDNESQIIASSIQPNNSNTANSFYTEATDSTPSIHPDEVCLDDIITESRSSELINSALDESILISSFSETKGSENSEAAKNSGFQVQASSINIDNKINEISTTINSKLSENSLENSIHGSIHTFNKSTSICSMFLEASDISKDLFIEDLTNSFFDSNVDKPLINKANKKFKLNNSSILSDVHKNNFEEPQYTSSPHISSSCINKKRKHAKQRAEYSSSNSTNSSNEEIVLTQNILKSSLKKNDNKLNEPSTCCNKSVIAENNQSGYSYQAIIPESLEKIENNTGTIPKKNCGKYSKRRKNNSKNTVLYGKSPDTSESPTNSWSPEIMDSGYPNSNSPPDLSPEYDLSSIGQDHVSDFGSPRIDDAPRFGFHDIVQIENRDLVNNNLDDQGNNMEAHGNQQVNDIRPLINVLGNDIENENDIYVVHNGFPIWLLRILQRFNGDGAE